LTILQPASVGEIGPKSELGQTRTSARSRTTSALAPGADIDGAADHVRKVPKADIIKRGAEANGVGLTRRHLRSCVIGRVSKRPEMRRY
jgi:hypothetical protein